MKEATLAQASHLLTLVNQKGTPAEQLQALYESGLLSDLLDANVEAVNRDEFRKCLGLSQLELKIIVDYDMTLREMIAAGRYDWVNDDITEVRFPVLGKGKDELVAELIHLNRSVSSEGAVALLDEMGLRPATIEELLAFGATFPETQRKFPILALGSSCAVSGGRRVACLGRYDTERYLYLIWWFIRWSGGYRFLAVRK